MLQHLLSARTFLFGGTIALVVIVIIIRDIRRERLAINELYDIDLPAPAGDDDDVQRDVSDNEDHGHDPERERGKCGDDIVHDGERGVRDE